jgi:hypothetical protein
LVKHARLIGVAALILVLLTSTYGYAQLSTPTVNGSSLRPEQGLPEITAPCANAVDYSTGTNGKTTADPPGTKDRWLVSGGGITVPQAAFSIGAFDSYATPSPTGRFSWISIQYPPVHQSAGPFTYSLQILGGALGGTFFLYAFSADNSVQLQLQTTTWSSGSYPSTSASDFNVLWTSGPPNSWLPTNAPASVALGPGNVMLTATVQNDPNTYTGLAVYAVFCPNTPPPFLVPAWTYAVKFICNMGISSDAQLIGLEPGFYQTDINIHNPSYSKTAVPIIKKFVLALPEDVGPPPAFQVVPAVPPSPYVLRYALLQPDAAMRLDCREILSLLSTGGVSLKVAKGFVIIISDKSGGNLDVWAEYTSLGATVGSTPSLEIVTINPKPFTP